MNNKNNPTHFCGFRIWLLWAFTAIVVMSPLGNLRAASPGEIYAKVQSEVSANPSHAASILKKELASLPRGERKKLAAGIFAAVLRGLGNAPLAEAVNLFTIAYEASPDSVGAFLDVAYAAYPSDIAAFTQAGLNAAQVAGQSDRGILGAIADLLSSHGNISGNIIPSVAGALGGTINPANIGGSVRNEVVSPEK